MPRAKGDKPCRLGATIVVLQEGMQVPLEQLRPRRALARAVGAQELGVGGDGGRGHGYVSETTPSLAAA